MKRINFKRFEIFTGIKRTTSLVSDIRKDLANMIYTRFVGLEAHALAYKIYGSEGELELNDEECKLLLAFVEQQASPSLIDSMRNALK